MTNVEVTGGKYPITVTFHDFVTGFPTNPSTPPPAYTIYGPDSKDTIKETGVLAQATVPITGQWGKIIDVSAYAVGAYIVSVTGDPGGTTRTGSTSFMVTNDRATVAALAAHDSNMVTEVDANEVKIDAVQAAVDAIQNNTRHILSVPQRINRPASGSTTYRFHFRLYDTAGNPEDPDADNVDIAIEDLSGIDIVAPGTMTKVTIGQYFFDFVVLSSFTLEPIVVLLDWLEATIAFNTVRASELVDDDVNESLTQTKLDAIQLVTDDLEAYTRSDINAPAVMVRPTTLTRVDMENDLGIGITTLVVDSTSAFPLTGYLRIDSELMSYTKVDSSTLTVVRAAFTTTDAIHLDDTSVYLVNKELVRATFFENKFQAITPVSADVDIVTEDGALFTGGPTHTPAIVGDELHYIILVDKLEIRGFGTTLQLFAVTKEDDTDIFFDFTLTSPATPTPDFPIVRGVSVVAEIPTTGDILTAVLAGGVGELRVDQDGYFQLDATRVLWTDVLKGPVREAVTGKRVDDAIISFWRVDQLDRGIFDTPAAQTKTDPNGNWATFLDPGRYLFTVRSFDLDFGDGELRDLVG